MNALAWMIQAIKASLWAYDTRFRSEVNDSRVETARVGLKLDQQRL